MMQAEKSVKITTKKQFEVMINFMLQNSVIARGQKISERTINKDDYERKWEFLTAKLNSVGPPLREVSGWQKVWNDYKLKVKKKLAKKLAHNEKVANATDDGSSKRVHFTSMDEKIIDLLSLRKTDERFSTVYVFEGKVENDSQDFGSFTQDYQLVKEEPIDQFEPCDDQTESFQSQHEFSGIETYQEQPVDQQKSEVTTKRKRRRAQTEDCKLKLLSRQTDDLERIPQLLMETNEHLKRISEVLEKKVRMDEEMHRKKEAELELRMEVLLLKKKKLSLNTSSEVT